MSSKRKRKGEIQASEARGKLSQLIETEHELDAMIKETRRRAAELIEAAKSDAEERIRRCELELESADQALHDRVAAKRDETIASVRETAKREAADLDELDQTKLSELADHVLRLLVGGVESEGKP